ncbi:glycosyl transferase family 2 [Methanothermus fervidus DSM 2088]|uniref:Glycosyl transferase family 2 n=1 Tax=Methanothermus fervidus (strain ATCC 43054 / DSM 2088 / JCM 10308 / V24 S) TaxID=523846 RepID=E3GWA3_METFV|nr:glycosyltransferase [Methanothermus fervidus]ADP77868.1 glycosyl transferase family 2 [Methanothermus fervidus DSM 2088]
MISVICVYNNEKILNDYLLRSLEKQVDHERILVDNRFNKFKSAAEALNYAGKKAKGDYLLFCHQDVELLTKDWLKKAEEILEDLDNLGVAGVAGVTKEGVKKNVIIHEFPPKRWGTPINKPVEVETVDECLFIVPREVFKKYKFDEKTCQGWHLYCVDYCLDLKKRGFKIYTLPLKIYHLSKHSEEMNALKTILNLGYHPSDYYEELKKILEKHKDLKEIHTTCGTWRTDEPLLLQRLKLLFSLALRKIQGKS